MACAVSEGRGCRRRSGSRGSRAWAAGSSAAAGHHHWRRGGRALALCAAPISGGALASAAAALLAGACMLPLLHGFWLTWTHERAQKEQDMQSTAPVRLSMPESLRQQTGLAGSGASTGTSCYLVSYMTRLNLEDVQARCCSDVLVLHAKCSTKRASSAARCMPASNPRRQRLRCARPLPYRMALGRGLASRRSGQQVLCAHPAPDLACHAATGLCSIPWARR